MTQPDLILIAGAQARNVRSQNQNAPGSDMPAPVLSVLTLRSFDEAIERSDGASYSLSAGVRSENVQTCLEFARRAGVGTVWTNTWMDGYPELPFGGVKESGLRRELGSGGIEEFLELKTVQTRIGTSRQNWI